MIKHEVLVLKKQKYIGLKTTVLFELHDTIDFCQLHKNVSNSDIKTVESKACFMALDTEFTNVDFAYIPLIPVESFENNGNFIQFTRDEGEYYAFEVVQKNCNPAWFKKVFEYTKDKGLNVEQKRHDLEYFKSDYLSRINDDEFKFEEEVFKILFKKKVI